MSNSQITFTKRIIQHLGFDGVVKTLDLKGNNVLIIAYCACVLVVLLRKHNLALSKQTHINSQLLNSRTQNPVVTALTTH